MKKIQKSNTEQFNSIFHSIVKNENKLLVWQFNEITKKRSVFNSFITEFDFSSNSVYCQTKDDNTFDIIHGDIFVYNEKSKTLFRAQQISTQNNTLSMHYPNEVVILEKSQNEKIKSIFIEINSDFISVKPTIIPKTKNKSSRFLEY